MTAICEDLRVVEFGNGSLATSLAGMVLADHGATVVKVEAPEGDPLRERLPSAFMVHNRGKRSLVADLRSDGGRKEALELAGNSDVVLDGFGPGVAERFGLGYEQLAADHPEVVYCSVTGFGPSGYSHLKGYEGVVAAKAGVYTLGDFGFRSGPIFFSVPLASVGAGHMALGGVLGALMVRERTGRGQRVEASLVQGLNPLDYFGTMLLQFMRQAGGGNGGATPSRHSFYVPTKDGRWVVFSQLMPHQAQALSRALGLEHTISDPRFADQPRFGTAEDAEAWEQLVWEALRTRTYAEWEAIFLEEPDIAFELARTGDEGLDHPQVRRNGEAIVVNDPQHGPVEQVGPVAQFERTPAHIERSSPSLGEVSAMPFESTGQSAGSTTKSPSAPLEGITIVELGYFYAMPFALTLAASLGARVVKVEGPEGDPMRTSFGAPDVGAAKTLEGKESLSVDLRHRDGQRIVRDLLREADVFVDGFRSGVAERLGLSKKELTELNPRLVHIHASGYGTEGPFSQRPIYAQVAGAVAGSTGRFAGRWIDPSLTEGLSTTEAQALVLPRLRGPIDGDSNAALGVFTALMLALYHQQRTGEGQFAATSMLSGNALAYADVLNRYSGRPDDPVQDDECYGLHALYRLYEASEGWVFLAAPRQDEWERLAHALGRSDLLDDARFSTAEDRRTHDDELAAVLGDALSSRDADHWESVLSAADVGCARAYEGSVGAFTTASFSEFTIDDPVMREAGLTVEVDHPNFGRIVRHGLPAEFSETPGRVARPCLLGEHTEDILSELGYDRQAISELLANGVVHKSA